jgi:phage-related protein
LVYNTRFTKYTAISIRYLEFYKDLLSLEITFSIEYQSIIYRVFCCFDEGKLIVLFNGFQKKTQKTPMNEIEKAMRIKKEYFESKK